MACPSSEVLPGPVLARIAFVGISFVGQGVVVESINYCQLAVIFCSLSGMNGAPALNLVGDAKFLFVSLQQSHDLTGPSLFDTLEDVLVSDSRFFNNSVTDGAGGAAIRFSSEASVRVSRTVFQVGLWSCDTVCTHAIFARIM